LFAARILVGLAIVLASPALGDSAVERARAAVVVGAMCLPWTATVFVAARRGRWESEIFGPMGDAACVIVLAATVPALRPVVAALFAAIVASATISSWRAALVVAVGAPAAAMVFAPVPHQPGAAMAVVVAGLVAVVLVMAWAGATVDRVQDEITALREKGDAVLARVADAVVVTDATGCIVQCNTAAALAFSKPAAEAVGQRCEAVLALCVDARQLDCTRGCALLAEADDDGNVDGDVWRHHETGRRQPLLANVSALTDAHGHVEVVHSMRDVTRVKQADEAKTLFLATASHELKTPLTVIRGFAAMLLQSDTDDPRRQRALDAIERRSVELSNIVDRLLLSSRIEAGRVDITVEPVSVGPVVAERCAAVRETSHRTIDVQVPDELPDVAGNRDAIATVVDHLLENAVKYSEAPAPVFVSLMGSEHHVEIKIADSGVGMDSAEAAHCFDKFWQAESSDVRRFAGTGIGLYIVRSLVEAMGGEVAVLSTPGHGSTFIVRLARSDSAAPSAHAGERLQIREFMRQIGVPS